MVNQYTPNENTEEINCWAFVEIFGHTKLAGRVSTKKLGANIMLQVDVPLGESEYSHSELFSPSAIFSIKPTTENWCRDFAKIRVSHDVLPYIPKEKQLTEEGQYSLHDIDDDN